MILHQYFLSCLSHASYLLGDESSGRAIVIDPQRDISGYLADAAAAGLHIERVIETHFHADFVSGHLELATATGATICYGEPAGADFAIEHLRDGQRLSLGEVMLEVRATPGHTPESICLVVYEHGDDSTPYGVLTGDTLFVGGVGRPDLLRAAGEDPTELASQLYRSVRDRLMTLPDATRVLPAHGPGSACGRIASDQTTSTIGQERQHDLALSATEDQFIAGVTGGQELAPPYFVYAARRNHQLRPLLAEDERPIPLGVDQVVQLCRDGAVVLDTRPPDDFAAGHLRGSLNVGLDGRFAQYAGTIVCPDQPVVLVAPPGTESEAKVRLARVGFDGVGGYLPARRRGPPGATGAGRPGRPHHRRRTRRLGLWHPQHRHRGRSQSHRTRRGPHSRGRVPTPGPTGRAPLLA